MLQVGANDAGGSRRRPWHAASVEALVALALAGSIVYVPVASSRTNHLRSELAAKTSEAMDASTLALTLRRNIELSGLGGLTLPEPLARELSATFGQRLDRDATGLLVMIYTPMVCQRALRAGLQSISNNRSLKEQRLAPYVVVVEQSPADRERALLMREEGILRFPLTFVPADTLIRVLVPNADDTFDEEPIYLRLDRQFHVRSAFHADQLRPELLDLWLEQSGDATPMQLSRHLGESRVSPTDLNQRGVRQAADANARDSGRPGPTRVESTLR